ncbi:GFO_IDH_MocA domain-containing protein [Meloidogyne graminicola]|uniref:Trans-1,2-dihydrobenzene-1,2-diol dehydrogenase n=1 Tax=Meloidogyne graminicola TaxID=189291 RepID=A0A8S9ZQR9_9BILA|nr:GFO_IDH_MocA domain-containing protein [Meloidogyne graminicola]
MTEQQNFLKEIRWGIAGTGRIGSDFVQAIKLCQTPNKIKGVASSDSLERAEKFCENNLLNKNEVYCYGNYKELFNNEFIDVVYVSNLNHQHKQTVLDALEANKNVLCEKPLAVNKSEVVEMIEKAKEKGLFLMEGYWSRCFPLWQDIISKHLKTLGNVQLFISDFGCPIKRVDSIKEIKYGGEGYLLGSGCYGLMLAQLVFNGEKPLEIIVNGKLKENGLDYWADILIKYSNNKLAKIFYSGQHRTDGSLNIYCANGSIRVSELFWCPEEAIIRNYPDPKTVPHILAIKPKTEILNNYLPKFNPFNYFHPKTAGLFYEIDHVSECIRKQLKESELMTLNDSLLLAEILDEIRKQLNIKYPQDLN